MEKKIQVKKEEGHYQVKSESSKKWYDVFPDRPFCTCPQFVFRCVKSGSPCKHIMAVRELEAKYGKESDQAQDIKIIEFIKGKGKVDSMELIGKFGESAVEKLKKSGDIIEEKGMISVL